MKNSWQRREKNREVLLLLSLSVCQACVNSYREGLRGKGKAGVRGRDTEGYGYWLPPDGSCALVLGTGIVRSPKPLSWPYIACFENFLAIDGRNSSQQYEDLYPGAVHMRARIYTERRSVALWHAFGITAVVLSERGGGRRRRRRKASVFGAPSLAPFLSWRGGLGAWRMQR